VLNLSQVLLLSEETEVSVKRLNQEIGMLELYFEQIVNTDNVKTNIERAESQVEFK